MTLTKLLEGSRSNTVAFRGRSRLPTIIYLYEARRGEFNNPNLVFRGLSRLVGRGFGADWRLLGADVHSLFSVQLLRAVAASMVVLHHIQLNVAQGLGLPNALPNLVVGSAGVDIFFVISGFVMVVSSDRLFGQPGATKLFLLRRLIRIVPLYWTATSIYVLSTGGGYTLAHTLASYFFIPYARPDGVVQPIHVVGWTLNYEMFFYLLFALVIALPRRLAVGAVIAGLGATVLIGRATPQAMDALTFWSQPVILNFVFGLGIGLAYKEGLRLPWPIAAVLIGTAAFLYAEQIGDDFPLPWERIRVYGFPAALLLTGATLGTFGPPPQWLRPLGSLGDSSYALYLLHTVVLWGCRMIAIKLALPVSAAPWAYVLAVMLASVIVAGIAHRLLDHPVTQWLRERLVVPSGTSKAIGAPVQDAQS
ncbi:acyltransferase family protein [Microvirga calopogonii]|uniref:acyltransferase family protein n=1 Tax=Microvirga calopogonii TaxID=2078013 RepID=UPI0013B380C1|nr:acyltransferase [Microvirga calopogonii]